MKRLKLLYAEDEKKTRRDQVIYIESRYDFDIYEADDGVQALALYKKYKPDIVLTDITMPNMSGLELAKEIRKISQQTKIIIATAHSEQKKLLEAFSSDVINYLLKPINREKLRSSIDTAIETLPKNPNLNTNEIVLNESSKFNLISHEYFIDSEIIKLSKSESKLLQLLCEYKNQDITAYDIFVHVWDDLDKEFSTDSVRTLVKKLRKKLPEGILKNIYGGFYKLSVK
ncbi:response regulator [Sulfurimonas aquatica]|uniref:Response regulator n=1 Tax=Sulfurimonas aquatica TaxID=2672570 RepID=A0A975B0L5_9BACT|nr:response regulator [Sulfurimonas aquatica]QSZ42012.1 response regulator [Sulfurimonas aquatica]